MSDRTEVIKMLEAIINMAEAALMRLGIEEAVYRSTEQGCLHPMEARIDESTMGEKRWRCQQCNYTHVEAIKTKEAKDGEISSK